MKRRNRFDVLAEQYGFKDRKGLLQAKLEEFGNGSKAAAALGVAVSTFNGEARKQGVCVKNPLRPHTGRRAEGGKYYFDDRPSNLPGPWKDRKNHPCRKCAFSGRDKNQPGCQNCQRRFEFLALFESSAPVSSFPDAPAPYRGGGICGIGYQEVY